MLRQDLPAGLRTLASLCASGIPLGRVVTVFVELAPESWKAASADLRGRVSRGATLSSALSLAVPALPPHLTAILRAGEASGDLAGALDRVAGDAERADAQRREVLQAIAYPSILILSAIMCAAVIVLYVLPQFEQLLQNLGRELPPGAKALVLLGRAAPAGTLVLSGALVLGGLLWRSMSEPDAERLDRWLLSVPLLGRGTHTLNVARISSALSSLLSTRVSPALALQLSVDIASNRSIAQRLAQCRVEVLRGKRLGVALEHTGVMPRRFAQLVRVGEEAGALPQAFDQIATMAYRENAEQLRRAIRFIEPAIVILIALLIGGVAGVLMKTMYGIRAA